MRNQLNQQRKPRILFCGEASYLNSGYSVYTHNVLKRLYATDKYTIGELGAFGSNHDPRAASVPWTFFGNLPNNEHEDRIYGGDPSNRFGRFKWEDSCVRFKPDICINIKDYWMAEFMELSPFRDYYYLALMLSIDAPFQNEKWLNLISRANANFGYTDWQTALFKEKLPQKQNNIFEVAPPAADSEIFKPLPNKKALKEYYGFDSKTVIGMVGRSQFRKLFGNLMESFNKLLDSVSDAQREKLCLYLHTSHNDIGWHLPELLKKNNLGNKVYFSYHCTNCGQYFPSLFRDSPTNCKFCNGAAIIPNSDKGLVPEQLNIVYNLMDVYVQLSKAGGFEMPLGEAALAGSVVLSIDYAAMSDVVRKVGGIPIKIKSTYTEMETGREFAVPDLEYLMGELKKLVQLPNEILAYKGFQNRQNALNAYSWDKTAKVWSDHIDSISFVDQSKTWLSPSKAGPPAPPPNPNIDNGDFIRYCLTFVARRPSLVGSSFHLRLLQDLNAGHTKNDIDLNRVGADLSAWIERPQRMPFNRENVYNICKNWCHEFNTWENIRANFK